jgi:phage shock protein A
MFDIGAGILSNQLEIYRWEDHFRRMRDRRNDITIADMQQALADLGQHYRHAVAQHNQLVDRYNAKLEENKRVVAAHATAIAQKDQRISELEENYEQLSVDWRERYITSLVKLTEANEEIKRLKIKAGELPPEG